MCLGALAMVVEVDHEALTARVDDGNTVRTVSLALQPHARLGDRVMVHTGFVLSVTDDAAATDRPGGPQP
jgi:hydrogenase assembly chaperone HypC/HupF